MKVNSNLRLGPCVEAPWSRSYCGCSLSALLASSTASGAALALARRSWLAHLAVPTQLFRRMRQPQECIGSNSPRSWEAFFRTPSRFKGGRPVTPGSVQGAGSRHCSMPALRLPTLYRLRSVRSLFENQLHRPGVNPIRLSVPFTLRGCMTTVAQIAAPVLPLKSYNWPREA